jgi:tetratricopeptide (TPR) repeat protein
VLAVQTRAKADLARSLANETHANRALGAANAELADSQAAVQARYDLAVAAIKTFHTGVSEDFLLKEEQFKELRDRLLKSAGDFYGRLGALLGKESDAASRKALTQANFEVAELTRQVGQSAAALAAHRQVLADREALAAYLRADAEIKTDVGRSLTAVADLLAESGQTSEAVATYRKAEELLAELAGSAPSPATAGSALAACRSRLGWLLHQTSHTDDGLAVLRLARADQEALASAPGAPAEFRSDLAATVNRIGNLLYETGQPAAAVSEYRQAVALFQKLADDHPAVTDFRSRLAATRHNLAVLLSETGQPAAAESEERQALAIQRKLADGHPAVTDFRRYLANSHSGLGSLLWRAGKLSPAETEFRQARAIIQKLADEYPERLSYRDLLALFHHNLGCLYSENGRLEEGEASLKQAIGIWERLAAEHPDRAEFAFKLAVSIGQMAYVRRTKGDLQGDYDWLTRGGRLIEDILRRAPDYNQARKRIPYGLPYFLKTSARLGRHAEAIAACDRAIGLLDGEERDRVRILRVLALARSGDHARAAVEANALAEAPSIPVGERSYDFACANALASAAARNDPKLEPAERSNRSEQLAARAVLLLDRSRIAGFFRDPAQVDRLVEDTDLDPLRARPDFKLLMMDLAFPSDPFAR